MNHKQRLMMRPHYLVHLVKLRRLYRLLSMRRPSHLHRHF
jgi:hypothetical protein